MQSLCILGRQSSLGIAELESLYGSDKLQYVSQQAVIVDVDPCLFAFDHLGGSIKLCKILTTLDTTRWLDIQRFLIQAIPEHVKAMPKGKMHLGLSVYGLNVNPKQIISTGLEIKRTIQSTGRSVRLIPNKNKALNSAQVIHNNLTSLNGWELIFARYGNRTICAQTVKEQNIEAYTLRDRKRPRRDMRVGMLPPKLAQIIINLARGELDKKTLEAICGTQEKSYPNLQKIVLDPFCGTGVILQESLLMGYDVYGTDIEPRMIEYARANLDWLENNLSIKERKVQLETGDAFNYRWKSFNIVASELYLGPTFIHIPDLEKIKTAQNNCNSILKRFLLNISTQLASGARLCLAVPAWQVKPSSFVRLPLLDHLEELGYNRLTFKHVSNDNLIYYRPDQIVGRELLVIIRK